MTVHDKKSPVESDATVTAVSLHAVGVIARVDGWCV